MQTKISLSAPRKTVSFSQPASVPAAAVIPNTAFNGKYNHAVSCRLGKNTNFASARIDAAFQAMGLNELVAFADSIRCQMAAFVSGGDEAEFEVLQDLQRRVDAAVEQARCRAERDADQARRKAIFMEEAISDARAVEIVEACQKNQYWSKEREGLFRWWLAGALKRAIITMGKWHVFKTLCGCHRYPVPAYSRKRDGTLVPTGAPGAVQLSYYRSVDEGESADGGEGARLPFGYSWVRKCESSLLCFVCAAKIRWHRANEIMEICLIMRNLGYKWIFVTYTAPHNLDTDPVEQVRRFNEARRRFKSGRYFQERYVDDFGFLGDISSVELTLDHPDSEMKTGPHYHVHCITFIKHDDYITPGEKDILEAEWQARWAKCLMDVGICTGDQLYDVLHYGLKIELQRQIVGNCSDDDLRRSIDDELIAKYETKGAAAEISPYIFSKDGNRPDRVSHWEYIALSLTTHRECIDYTMKIVSALKGRHAFHFSPKVMAVANMDIATDDEILREKSGDVVFDFTAEEWNAVDKYKAQPRILVAAVDDIEKFGIDVTNLPVVEDGDGSGGLDFSDEKVQKVCAVFRDKVDLVVAGIDPISGFPLAEVSLVSPRVLWGSDKKPPPI